MRASTVGNVLFYVVDHVTKLAARQARRQTRTNGTGTPRIEARQVSAAWMSHPLVGPADRRIARRFETAFHPRAPGKVECHIFIGGPIFRSSHNGHEEKSREEGSRQEHEEEDRQEVVLRGYNLRRTSRNNERGRRTALTSAVRRPALFYGRRYFWIAEDRMIRFEAAVICVDAKQ